MEICTRIIDKNTKTLSNQVDKHLKKVFDDIEDKLWLFAKNINTDQPSKN